MTVSSAPLLPEQLLVLSLDPRHGRVPLVRADVASAVAAAELVELVAVGRVHLEDQRVRLLDGAPTGRLGLDEALAAVPAEGRDLVAHLQAAREPAQRRWLEALVHSGVVGHERDRLRGDRYPLLQAELRGRLHDEMVEGCGRGDDRALALAALLDAAGVLAKVAPSLAGVALPLPAGPALAAAVKEVGAATALLVVLITAATASAT